MRSNLNQISGFIYQEWQLPGCAESNMSSEKSFRVQVRGKQILSVAGGLIWKLFFRILLPGHGKARIDN